MARKQEPTTQQQIGALVTPQLLKLLDAAFPSPSIVPGFDRDQLVFDAGKRAALDFLSACRGHYTTSDQEPD